MIITIDGPSASGKSSIARLLAQRLGYLYLSSGLLYRAVAYVLTQERGSFSPDDIVSCEMSVKVIDQLSYTMTAAGDAALFYRGVDITLFLKLPEIDSLTSRLSVQPLLRATLVDWQRRIVSDRSAVIDGRDAGTVVFPYADYKFFLTASPYVRAMRWYDDQLRRGAMMSKEDALAAIGERDYRDSTRSVSPLRAAHNARSIDSTDMNLDETLKTIIAFIEC